MHSIHSLHITHALPLCAPWFAPMLGRIEARRLGTGPGARWHERCKCGNARLGARLLPAAGQRPGWRLQGEIRDLPTWRLARDRAIAWLAKASSIRPSCAASAKRSKSIQVLHLLSMKNRSRPQRPHSLHLRYPDESHSLTRPWRARRTEQLCSCSQAIS